MNRVRIAILAALLPAGLPLFLPVSPDSDWMVFAQEKQDQPAVSREKPKESRTAYLRRMYEKDRATYGDACRAILSAIKEEHSDAEFSVVVTDLSGRGVVVPEWGIDESGLLTKGTLAYMTCRALDIKGGVTMRLFGINRRYALRECVHRGLIAGGTTDEYVKGRELIDVMTNAGIHKEQGHTDSQYK